MVLRECGRLRADPAGAGRCAPAEKSRSLEDDTGESGGDRQSRVSSPDCPRLARRRSIDGRRASGVTSGARVQTRECGSTGHEENRCRNARRSRADAARRRAETDARSEGSRGRRRVYGRQFPRRVLSHRTLQGGYADRSRERGVGHGRERRDATSPRLLQATVSPTRWCAGRTRSTRWCPQLNSSRFLPKSTSRRLLPSCFRGRRRTT